MAAFSCLDKIRLKKKKKIRPAVFAWVFLLGKNTGSLFRRRAAVILL